MINNYNTICACVHGCCTEPARTLGALWGLCDAGWGWSGSSVEGLLTSCDGTLDALWMLCAVLCGCSLDGLCTNLLRHAGILPYA